MESFKNRLKRIRWDKQLSQKQVAEMLGIPVSTYANWEQGRTQPSVEDIRNIISLFDIDANELFKK